MYEFGVTRSFANSCYASLGFFYSEASTSGNYFTPLVPDTDLYIGSFGGGRKGEHWNWALAFQIVAGDYRSVENQTLPSVDGRYKLFTPTVSFSVRYHFQHSIRSNAAETPSVAWRKPSAGRAAATRPVCQKLSRHASDSRKFAAPRDTAAGF